MKYWQLSFSVVVVSILLLLSGCVDQEEVLAPKSGETGHLAKTVTGDRYLVGFTN